MAIEIFTLHAYAQTGRISRNCSTFYCRCSFRRAQARLIGPFASCARNLGDAMYGRWRSFPLISINVDLGLQVSVVATSLVKLYTLAHLQLSGGLSQSKVWYVRTIQSVFAWLSIRWIRLKLEKREIFSVACTREQHRMPKSAKRLQSGLYCLRRIFW